MPLQLQSLRDLYPRLSDSYINAKPLEIIDVLGPTDDTDLKCIDPAIAIATVLYNWCPDALCAFLDVKAWFSMTWNLTVSGGELASSVSDESNGEATVQFEISRIRSQVTFGRLDGDGCWEVVSAYDIYSSASEDYKNGGSGGHWIPNTQESMVGERYVGDGRKVDELAREVAHDLVVERRWLHRKGKKMKFKFFVEPHGAPVDAFGDGMQIDPRWLYGALDLSRCVRCGKEEEERLRRCGRCGTAAYCSPDCQVVDWNVHQGVCTMGPEERGKALWFSRSKGLIGWDWGAVSDDGMDVAESEEAGKAASV